MTSSDEASSSQELQVDVSTDKFENSITIQDNGVGMTKEELIKNLGTIARSGSKEFLKNVSEKGDDNIVK